MKVRRIEVEAANGDARLWRDAGEADIHIEGRRLEKGIETEGAKTALVYDAFSLLADARDHEHQMKVARILQSTLDGYRGTAGDVAAYARLIEMLAD